MSKSLNFKGPNCTHAQILTLCVCGLDKRKMTYSHGLEEVLLHDSLLCVGTNHVIFRLTERVSNQEYLKSTQLSNYDRGFNW